MFSIGFFELCVVALVAVLALKPEQITQGIKFFKRSLFKVRQYTSTLEQEFILEEKERELQKRIELASKVSDVSDLLPEDKHEKRNA